MSQFGWLVPCELCDRHYFDQDDVKNGKTLICEDCKKILECQSKMENGSVYRPTRPSPPLALNATLAVKFAQRQVLLDPWYIFGGTRWSRTLYRLKHPLVYSKRGLLEIYRR